MARCGCGTGCNCVVQSALPNCIPVTGNGSIRLPYTVGLTLAPDTATVTNVLQCTNDGLLVDENSLNVAVLAQNGITGDGLLGSELEVIYSADAGNQAAAGSDGHVFVPEAVTVTQLPIQGDGTGGSPVNLLLSADAGNSATLGGDGGVFVPTGGAASVITTGCVIGNGLPGTPLDLDFNPNSSIQCGASGLELDLDGTNGGTSGLSDTAAGLRVAERSNGGLRRTGSGLTQTAPQLQLTRTVTVGHSGSNGGYNVNSQAMTASPINALLTAGVASYQPANGFLTSNVNGVYQHQVTLRIPSTYPSTFNGMAVNVRRQSVIVVEGQGGIYQFDIANSNPEGFMSFPSEAPVYQMSFTMPITAGQYFVLQNLVLYRQSSSLGNLGITFTWLITYLGDV